MEKLDFDFKGYDALETDDVLDSSYFNIQEQDELIEQDEFPEDETTYYDRSINEL